MKKSEEQILFPDITVGDIIIKPWSFGILFSISEYLDILLKKAEGRGMLDNILNKDAVISYVTVAKILSLVNKEALQIVAVTIDKSYDEIKEFDLGKGIKILTAIFTQNFDIIKNRVKSDAKISKFESGTLLSEVFCVLLQNSIAKDLNELKYEFSVDQIYLFYEKVKKISMGKERADAVILANALTYTGQCYSKKDLQNRTKQWQNFMKSLDWERLEERTKKPEFKKVVNLFNGLGIPITKKKDK